MKHIVSLGFLYEVSDGHTGGCSEYLTGCSGGHGAAVELELGAPVERGVDLVGKSASTQLEVQGGFPINHRGGGMVLVRLGRTYFLRSSELMYVDKHQR